MGFYYCAVIGIRGLQDNTSLHFIFKNITNNGFGEKRVIKLEITIQRDI